MGNRGAAQVPHGDREGGDVTADICRECSRDESWTLIWRCAACQVVMFGPPLPKRGTRTDAEILERVEIRVGMGAWAWDCVDPIRIVQAFREELA